MSDHRAQMPVPGIPRKEDKEQGPIGFFGGMQGATPKYARNDTIGGVADDFRGSMARMFIYVSAEAAELRVLELTQKFGGEGTGLARAAKELYGNGYIDFLLQSVQTGQSEKLSITENLADGYVAYYLGQQPTVIQFSGMLINSMQDDQVVSMVSLYDEVLRGTRLAEHGETLRIRFDSFMYAGTLNNLQWGLSAEGELACPFSFSFLVKSRVIIPSKYFRPVSLESGLTGLERGHEDTVGHVLTAQRVAGTAPPVVKAPPPAVEAEADSPKEAQEAARKMAENGANEVANRSETKAYQLRGSAN